MSVDVITATCPGDKGRAHASRPQIIQKFYRAETSGGWFPATEAPRAQRQDKQRRSTYDRRDKPAGMTTALDALKHIYACRLCGNSLQVGEGQWARMETALETLSAVGDSFTLDTLRRAYESSPSKQL